MKIDFEKIKNEKFDGDSFDKRMLLEHCKYSENLYNEEFTFLTLPYKTITKIKKVNRFPESNIFALTIGNDFYYFNTLKGLLGALCNSSYVKSR